MFKYLTSNYMKALSKETDLLNRARIKLLTIILILFIFQRIISLCLLTGEAESFYIWRSALLLVFLTLTFILLLSGVPWKLLGHFYILSLIFFIWSSIITLKQAVNLATLQYILIIISFTYYILGTRLGLIYSLLNILPIVALVFSANYSRIHLINNTLQLNIRTFNFIFLYNFFSILFVHYYFFNAFKKTNQREKQLSLTLQRSLKDAQDIASAKTNFLSTMSHELRTPLNAVVGMANILLMDDLKPEQKENLEVLRFSAENLMFIINDILEFTKIDADKVVLQNNPFQLHSLLRNIYKSFIAETTSKMIQFNFKCDPGLETIDLLGDKDKLSQILLNLIGNAIKFTAKGSVTMEAVICRQDLEKISVLFVIQDTGIGISLEQQRQIFDPYVQKSRKSSRQFYGTGLGLTIASRLISLKGGILNILSNEGKGTRLSFELTFNRIKKHEMFCAVKQSTNEKEIGALRVLIAEDNAINIVVIKKLLNKWGIEPVITENGKEAVDAVISQHYDVILMDINMPLMDGFEASKAIRNLPDKKKASIPIIALTASVDATIEQHPGYAYLNDYILKPFSPDLLKDKLDKLTGSQ